MDTLPTSPQHAEKAGLSVEEGESDLDQRRADAFVLLATSQAGIGMPWAARSSCCMRRSRASPTTEATVPLEDECFIPRPPAGWPATPVSGSCCTRTATPSVSEGARRSRPSGYAVRSSTGMETLARSRVVRRSSSLRPTTCSIGVGRGHRARQPGDVCSFHHTLVHEGGWGVSLDADGVAVWCRPSGRRHEPGPAPPEGAPEVRVIEENLWAQAAGYSPLFDLLPSL